MAAERLLVEVPDYASEHNNATMKSRSLANDQDSTAHGSDLHERARCAAEISPHHNTYSYNGIRQLSG